MQERRLIICLVIAIVLPFVALGLLLPTPSLAIDPSSASVSIQSANCTQANITWSRTPNTDDGSGIDYYRITLTDNKGTLLALASGGAPLSSGPKTTSRTLTYNSTSTGNTLYATMYDQTSINGTDPNGPQLASASIGIPCGPGGASPTPLPSTTPIPTTIPAPTATTIPGMPTATPIPTATPGGPKPTPPATAAPVLGPSYYPPDRRVMASIRRDTPVYGTPDTKGQTLGVLKAGQTWFVTGTDSTGQFNEVFLGGPELGWVKAADVAMQGALPALPGANPPAPGGAIAQTNPMGSAVITAYTLRIRSGPSLENPQIGLAYQNDSYTIFAKKGVWLNVSGPGGAGWVHGDWVRITNLSLQPSGSSSASATHAQASSAASGPLPGVVLAYTLRLRAGPRLSSPQIGMANQNEVYTIVGQSPSGIWLNISGPGGSGWVDGSYVKVLGARSQLPVMR